jgi:hypothetical protein
MHVIQITHEQCGFSGPVACADPQNYGPFNDVSDAEGVLRGKLWVKSHVTEKESHRWAAHQGSTRVLIAEVVPLVSFDETQCLDPYNLPSGGVHC